MEGLVEGGALAFFVLFVLKLKILTFSTTSTTECCDISTWIGQKNIRVDVSHKGVDKLFVHPGLPSMPREDEQFVDYFWGGHNDVVAKLYLGCNVLIVQKCGSKHLVEEANSGHIIIIFQKLIVSCQNYLSLILSRISI